MRLGEMRLGKTRLGEMLRAYDTKIGLQLQISFLPGSQEFATAGATSCQQI